MAYNITLTNGEPLVNIADGTVDVNFTSLSLVGKNYPNYGELVNENFVHLLENFADVEEPTNPIVGQIWYDSNIQNIKVRTNNDLWKTIGATAVVSPTPPIGFDIGDHWWNTVRKQLYVYDGSNWVLIGPQNFLGTKLTGSVPDIIKDTSNADHIVLKFYVNDVVTAIWCKEDNAFTVLESDKIPNFFVGTDPQILRPGLTFATLGTQGSPVEKNTIWGTVDNALRLGEIESGKYLRKDSAAGVQTVNTDIAIESNLQIANVILPKVTDTANIGSPDNRFNVIYAKRIVGAEIVGDLGIANSDDLAEGDVNLYFTAERQAAAREYSNLVNVPVLVESVTFNESTKTVSVTKTNGDITDIGSIVGYTGSKGDRGDDGSVLWKTFDQAAASPGPLEFEASNVTGFYAYNSTDFPNVNSSTAYYVGMNVRSPGAPAAQLAMHWNVENDKPNLIFFRTNDDTGDTQTWSPWTRILVEQDLGGAANQILFKNTAGQAIGSSGLTFNGTDLTCTGDIVAYSDMALKTNIKSIENPLDIIRGLRGVTYDRIDIKKSSAGLLADDAERVIPQLVSKDDEGRKKLNYNGFTGVFVEAIKKLEAEIEELKRKLSEK